MTCIYFDKVNISKQDLLRALGSSDFMGGSIVDDDVDQGAPSNSKDSKEVLHVDHLFKRENSEFKRVFSK